jgi:hypothetical protein
MSAAQHAPSPDYSIAEAYVDWTILFCCDCADLCLTTGGDRRCEPCQQYHLDEVASLKRALLESPAATVALLRSMGAGSEAIKRTGGLNDPGDILCRECGESAGEYVGYVDHLDGKAAVCPHCATHGKIVVDDDEGAATIYFRAFTPKELGL